MVSIDLLMVLLFLLVTFAVGIWYRKHTTLDDYWVNGRSTSTFALMATMLSTYVGAGVILGNAGIAYSGAGLASFVIAGSFLFYFILFGVFFAPKIHQFGRKHNAYTLPDYFEVRYSKNVRLVGAIVTFVSFGLYLALQMMAISIFVTALTDISPLVATIIGGVVVVAYTTIGGLKADIRTDLFQFFVMLLLLFVFLPMIIVKGGGLGAIGSLPKDYLLGESFAPWYVYIFGFLFIGAGAITSADLWQRAYAGKNARSVRKAVLAAVVMVVCFDVMAILFGIYGHILVPSATANNIVPELLNTTVPAGLYGLVLAGFFAAIMSSADSMLLISSMTVVHDFYQKYLGRTLPKEKVLRISRWVTLLLGVLAIGIAAISSSIVHLAIDSISYYVALLPAIVFGFYWKKATATAAFWSIVSGALAITVFLFIDRIFAFIPGIIVSFAVFIAISLWQSRRV